ncbi:MAG: serine/threonine protein kinase, partial [Gammaproteobacteria bacterium]|nr:serine/threonine protein kinase [Gammaproteobacteria bacterium]
MGAVYIAEQNHPFRRWVALKIVKLGMDTKEVIARFEAERQALALMNHPNIARILDAGMISTGRPYFVMEYVPGIPITKYCDEKRLGIGKRLELFVEVCRAVQHAHQKGVIHRDLKPSNILVMEQDGQPVPKIIDFGIAKATHLRLSNHSLHTQAGNLMGTPEYMSPEQISSSLDIDTRTDVYSLGVILCELLTGKLPFPECSGPGRHTDLSKIRLTKKDNEHLLPSTILRRALDDEHIALLRSASVHSLTRQLRGDLDWIAAKALENDRGRRYAMPLALAGDICNYLHNEPISAGPPSAIYRLKKFAHRNRLVVSVLTSIFGLVIALNVMIGVQAERLAIERDRANTEARAAAETSDFLLDVFNTDNPSTTGKSKSAVKRLLDKRVVRINRELAQQPLARMRVLYTLGRAYQYMGFTEEALKLYEEIYQFYEAEL